MERAARVMAPADYQTYTWEDCSGLRPRDGERFIQAVRIRLRVPEVVARLTALAQKAREDLGDLNRPGKNQRPAAMVENPTPRVMER